MQNKTKTPTQKATEFFGAMAFIVMMIVIYCLGA